MIKQNVIASVGVASILAFGFLTFLGLESTQAFEWWKWPKYEKWNCCPNSSFKPISNQESDNKNEIIQNIEINQIWTTLKFV